jgi:hypothetical protein
MRVHSLLSPKCLIKPSPIAGQGVFADRAFELGEFVAVWGGKIYTAEEVERMAALFPRFASHTVSMCEGYYLGSEDLFELDDSELFNHSCAASVGVQGQVVVVARRPIEAGEELTFDYDTTETSAEPFACRCGMASCRGVVQGAGWRDAEFVRQNWPYLAWHVQQAVLRENPDLAAECMLAWARACCGLGHVCERST